MAAAKNEKEKATSEEEGLDEQGEEGEEEIEGEGGTSVKGRKGTKGKAALLNNKAGKNSKEEDTEIGALLESVEPEARAELELEKNARTEEVVDLIFKQFQLLSGKDENKGKPIAIEIVKDAKKKFELIFVPSGNGYKIRASKEVLDQMGDIVNELRKQLRTTSTSELNQTIEAIN